ncbi:hypothetical protein C4580_04360 [Candidatus Woesearchaeota archaeon]|nr:MAG: hypothetical protein C4580_04360 [Candidatus Woesearchaeota archaeon]
MKRGLLLLVLFACAVPEAEEVLVFEPEVSVPVFEEEVSSAPDVVLSFLPERVIVARDVRPYSFLSSAGGFDRFGIVQAERYDALYSVAMVDVNVSVFVFSSRAEVEFVLGSYFRELLRFGAQRHGENIILVFLSSNDHRVAVWSSGTRLVYVDTAIPDFVSREVLEVYLNRYPSDVVPDRCIDFDGGNHFDAGKTSQVWVGSKVMQWTDACLRDVPWYVPEKRISFEGGLLEGRCSTAEFGAGYIEEYECARGCEGGRCVLA